MDPRTTVLYSQAKQAGGQVDRFTVNVNVHVNVNVIVNVNAEASAFALPYLS